MTTALFVPQWQGSGSAEARRLRAGAQMALERVEADRVVEVPVPDQLGPKVAGVRARDVLAAVQRSTLQALASIDDFVLTIGGDCSVDLGPIIAARDRFGDTLTVVWLDAHPDVYSPESLPSGAFHAMVVRALLGDGPDGLKPARPLDPSQLMVVGERAGAAVEHAYLAAKGLRRYGVADVERAFEELDGPVYVHLDLDVLEPKIFGSTCYPEPDGIDPEPLIELISRLDQLVGAAITECAPADAAWRGDEARVLTRLASAMTR